MDRTKGLRFTALFLPSEAPEPRTSTAATAIWLLCLPAPRPSSRCTARRDAKSPSPSSGETLLTQRGSTDMIRYIIYYDMHLHIQYLKLCHFISILCHCDSTICVFYILYMYMFLAPRPCAENLPEAFPQRLCSFGLRSFWHLVRASRSRWAISIGASIKAFEAN